jgi:hypothetical protein
VHHLNVDIRFHWVFSLSRTGTDQWKGKGSGLNTVQLALGEFKLQVHHMNFERRLHVVSGREVKGSGLNTVQTAFPLLYSAKMKSRQAKEMTCRDRCASNIPAPSTM